MVKNSWPQSSHIPRLDSTRPTAELLKPETTFLPFIDPEEVDVEAFTGALQLHIWAAEHKSGAFRSERRIGCRECQLM